jgi:hypothetical protein
MINQTQHISRNPVSAKNEFGKKTKHNKKQENMEYSDSSKQLWRRCARSVTAERFQVIVRRALVVFAVSVLVPIVVTILLVLLGQQHTTNGKLIGYTVLTVGMISAALSVALIFYLRTILKLNMAENIEA